MTTPGNYLECVQGTELWKQLRCGYVTASRVADVIATVKKGESAARKDYRTELICERLTGNPYPRYVTHEMQWGIDHEADAAIAYELQTGELVDRCGFVIHPTVSMFGASPDRLVGDKGLLQVKCPTTKTHMEWLLSGTIPVEHIPQMLAELSCDPAREWVDFMSFDPRLPDHLRRFIRRYHRDQKLIAALEAEVAHFNAEIDEILGSLPQAPAPVAGVLDQVNDDEAQF